MKLLTKLVLAAGAGYALRAYVKKDNAETPKVYAPPRSSGPTISDAVGDYLGKKISYFLWPEQSRGNTQTPYERRYATPSRYLRFGRKGSNR